jgi:hypothetical protein
LHNFLEKYNLADHKQVFKSNKLYLDVLCDMEQSELQTLDEFLGKQTVEKLVLSVQAYKNGLTAPRVLTQSRQKSEQERLQKTHDFLYTLLQNIIVWL